ncbi:hypothetical protein PQD69_gp085 [Carnobacterium phage cd4]|uniref:Uncharacterized protein n=1 Tax=Carnobacterium phage cd4 TaxID=2849246 RepID=A0AAE7SWQ7_9CAUD|nr:hypothetical protein PQD69_gp085 [Carnobacterium phage cd4]QXP45425.1 hypothetical protein cd4_085 [Carnobacterium phage cd4]
MITYFFLFVNYYFVISPFLLIKCTSDFLLFNNNIFLKPCKAFFS